MVIELSRLEPVSIRTVWPHEERDFTPWLAEHFDYLNDALDTNMVVVAQEAEIAGAGRADIVAPLRRFLRHHREPVGGFRRRPFRENAALRGSKRGTGGGLDSAGISQQPPEILRWLNEHSDLDIYCVEVSAWSIGGSVAPMFRRVVPNDWIEPKALKRRVEIQQYRSFYRPLVARLTEAGMVHVDPEWGTTTGYQWFESGYDGIYFGLAAAEDDKDWAFLLIDTGDEDRSVYRALLAHREKMERELGATLDDGTHDATGAWIGFVTEASSIDDAQTHEAVREWMHDNLLNLQAVLTPYLEAAVTAQDG